MFAPQPHTRDERRKRRLKQRRILAAFSGLSIGFLVALAYRLTGYWSFRLEDWAWLVAATAVVHVSYWLLLQLGWDRHLRWDPTFLYLPWATTVFLLCLSIYLLPEARVFMPLAHLINLLFLVGLVGFRDAVNYSILASAGYFVAVYLVWRRGEPVELGYEAMMAVLILALGTFAGTVLERVRRRKLEIREAWREILKLSQAVEQSPSLLIITDTEGRIEYVNPKFTKTTGYSPEEVIGRKPSILKSDETPAETHEELWRTITSGGEWLGEFKNLKKDGDPFWVIASISPIRDHLGNITNYLGVQEDTTALREAQARLVQAQRLEGVGRLVSGVAHDFNNLLTSVLGFAELALSKVPVESSVYGDIQEIRKAGESATALTQQLLAFSRKQMSRPQVLDLNHQLSEMEALLRRTISAEIEFSTVFGSDLGRIRADPAQLQQILMNLAVNASDAMPQGGRLVIETANAELGRRYGKTEVAIRPGPYVKLTVSDTGRGMDEPTRRHIFEPFFTTKKQGLGTGLGLATVYGIVKQNRGYVWAESEVGSGSIFTVFLPREHEEIAPIPAPVATRTLSGVETLLVVEDEEAVRLLAERILENQGYRVLVAEEPAKALSLAAVEPIDLLVTDIVMPGMNGVDLAQRITAARPKVKVLLFSGYAERTIVEEKLADPRTPFLGKPFGVDELLNKVREVLDGDP